MTTPAFTVPSGIAVSFSFCPRERRLVDRSSRDYDHTRAVLAARPRYLRAHQGRIPPLALHGCRTVNPTVRRAP